MQRKIFSIIMTLIFIPLILCSVALSQTEYTSSDLRDPFKSQLPKKPPKLVGRDRPGVGEDGKPITPPEIVVQSLIAGSSIPQAIIDGGIWRIGDKLKEVIITDITKDGVEGLYQGETFLFPAPSRKLRSVEDK